MSSQKKVAHFLCIIGITSSLAIYDNSASSFVFDNTTIVDNYTYGTAIMPGVIIDE